MFRNFDAKGGRLDGAERIVTALMPDPDDAAERNAYIERIQDAIVVQEFSDARKSRREAMLKRLVGSGNFKQAELDQLLAADSPVSNRKSFTHLYDKPLSSETKQLAGWGSRATRILAQTLDDLPGDGALGAFAPRLAGPVRTGSVLTARPTLFAMPGGYPRMVAERALFLVLLAGALLVAVSWFVPDSMPAWPGLAVVGLTGTLWVGLVLWSGAARLAVRVAGAES